MARLSDVEAAVARFYVALRRAELDAWRVLAPALADARRRAQKALDEAAQRAQDRPDDAGARFVAARASVLVAEIDAAYTEAARVAAGAVQTATTTAGVLGAGAAGAVGGVFGAAWVDVNVPAVGALAAASAPGEPVALLLQSLGRDAATAAVRELVAGAALGYNPKRTARNMVRAAHTLASARARTIARTETLRAFRSAHLAAYRQNADVLDGWTWVARLDERTCPLCWALHGSVHPVDEAFAGHPNCRCRPIAIPAGLSAEERAAYLGRTGPEAFANLTAAQRRAILGPARADLYEQGRLRLEDVVAYADSPVWGRTVRLRRIADTPRRRRRRRLARR